MTIDVWMQHPTQRFLNQEAFESLRRWTGQQIPEDEIPIDGDDRGHGRGGDLVRRCSARGTGRRGR